MIYTNEQKKKMVEYGVKQFALNPEFLNWLIDEFNIVYIKLLELKCENCKLYNHDLEV